MIRYVLLRCRARKYHRWMVWPTTLPVLSLTALAQKPAARISGDIVNSERVVIGNTHSPRATSTNDAGRVSPETKLQGMSLVFRRSDEQETALLKLIKA